MDYLQISVLFYSCLYVYSFTGSRAGCSRALYYIYMYISEGGWLRWGRPRPRLASLSWSYVVLGPSESVSVIGLVATGMPTHPPIFWFVFGDVGSKPLVL